jgi:hypothetical protein
MLSNAGAAIKCDKQEKQDLDAIDGDHNVAFGD